MISLNLLGSIFFLFLFWSRVNFVFEMGWQGTAYALIILQSGMAGVLIVINAKPIKDAGFMAAIAAWIGAAPRQRGSNEPCTFTHPLVGISRKRCGKILPYETTTKTSGRSETSDWNAEFASSSLIVSG